MATSIPVALRINDRGVPTVSSGPSQDRWPPVTRDQSRTVRDLRPGPDGDQDGTLDSAVPAFYQEVPRGAGLRDWFGAAGRNHGWGGRVRHPDRRPGRAHRARVEDHHQAA